MNKNKEQPKMISINDLQDRISELLRQKEELVGTFYYKKGLIDGEIKTLNDMITIAISSREQQIADDG